MCQFGWKFIELSAICGNISGLFNGLVPDKRQTITWTNDGPAR